MDSLHATEVCSAICQNVSFSLHISLTSTHVVLKSHNPWLLSGLSISLSPWATSLSGKPMSDWTGEWTDRIDGWKPGYICFCVATLIHSIYTDQFLFLCARVAKLVWSVTVNPDAVRESLPNHCFLWLHCSFKRFPFNTIYNSNSRGLSTASNSQME